MNRISALNKKNQERDDPIHGILIKQPKRTKTHSNHVGCFAISSHGWDFCTTEYYSNTMHAITIPCVPIGGWVGQTKHQRRVGVFIEFSGTRLDSRHPH